MRISELSKYFSKIEKTSSRNEITAILGELFTKLSGREVQIVSYISLGALASPCESIEFNMAEKTIIELVSILSQKQVWEIEKKFKETGDMGELTSELLKEKNTQLEIEEVYENLLTVSKVSGLGSQKEKTSRLKSLFNQLDRLSAKYVVRFILKRLRLGFSEMTILDGLSYMEKGNKDLRKEIEKAYNISADIGRVARIFKERGLLGLETIKIESGIPVRSSAAERLSSPEEIFKKTGPSYIEPKIDGFRLQVHFDKNKKDLIDKESLFPVSKPLVRFYSRNLENMTEMFPDIKNEIEKLSCESIIIEGEAIGYNLKENKFLTFQQTISRKRKYEIEKQVKETPLTLFVFDLLYLNGKSYLEEPFSRRREELLKLFKGLKGLQLIEEKEANSAKDISLYFKEKKKAGFEGIMIKMKEAPYIAGARGFHWIKFKREEGEVSDSIDVVVLGYYVGKGRRTHFGIGALLVGVYNKNSGKFETIAKIGTGIKDEEFLLIKKDLDKIKLKSKPKNVIVAKELFPDFWVDPKIVAVVLADEITTSPLHTVGKGSNGKTGFALRFPRLIQWARKDKNPEQTTSSLEIKKMYQDQFNY